MAISLKEIIAPHFHGTFNSKAPHQIDKGGRGSAKTSKNALKIPIHQLEELNCPAVIIKRYQNTLRDSVYAEIKRGLSRLGLREGVNYIANLSPLRITLHNGNKVYFAGGDDYEKIKGTIDENSPIKIVWFEELTEFDSEEDIEQIIATFSRGNDDWFIVLYSYNPPKNKYHWVNKWAEKKKKEGYLITNSDYRGVPAEWLGRRFIEEAERLQKYDEKRYNWIYLGEVIGMEGSIYNFDHVNLLEEKKVMTNADDLTSDKLRVRYLDFAIDGGHQTSATVCGCLGYLSNGTWCLLDSYYYSPKEKTNKKAPSELSTAIFDFQLEMSRKWRAEIDDEVIDSAEGALRNQYFKDYGKRLTPVNKGKNKQELIEYSIDFLSTGNFFVLDNKNNSMFLKEMKNYTYKEGSIEKGKPEPDKRETELKSDDVYYNTHSREYSYYFADHTCDMFQYWVKNNLRKLNLKA